MTAFFVAVLLIYGLFSLWLWRRVYLRFPLLQAWRRSYTIVVVLVSLLPWVNTRVLGHLLPPSWLTTSMAEINRLSYSAFALWSIAVVIILCTEAVIWSVERRRPLPVNQQRRALLAAGVASGLVAAAGASEAEQLAVVRVEVPIADLPPAFDGFTIAQVTDLHLGPILRGDHCSRVVDRVNALEPDLIALTGDMVDGFVDTTAAAVAPLARLKARSAICYVTGNHEFYWDGAGWIDQFRRLGAQVLENSHLLVKRGDSTLVIAGVHDLSTRKNGFAKPTNVAAAFADAPPAAVRILLAHHPGTYAEADGHRVALQLSGHTHGGQYFPFTLLIHFFHRYARGLYRRGDGWIYVSCGTGFWGPPLRTTGAGEITLLTLKRSSS